MWYLVRLTIHVLLLTMDTLKKKLHHNKTPQSFCSSLEMFPSQLCGMLMQCVALACACNCINFGLLGSGVSASLTAAVVTVAVLV